MLKLRAIVHACAWLANYLNPVAKLFDSLHEGCRGIFLADYLHINARPDLPLVKSPFKLTVHYS